MSLSNHGQQKRVFSEGFRIFKEGERADVAYYIQTGSVEIYKSAGSSEVIIAVLEPGEIFGEMALLEKRSHSCSARAFENNTSVLVISREALDKKLENTDVLIKNLIFALVRRLHDTDKKLMKKT